MIRTTERVVALTLALVMLTLCAIGCTQPDEPGPSVTPTISNDPPIQVTDPTKIPSNPTRPTEPVQSYTGLRLEQLRLPGYDKGWISRFHMVFGEFHAVNNPQSLQDALEALKISLNLPETYDADFFAKHQLVLIPMQSGSGSTRYSAEATVNMGQIEITVSTLPMEVGTADMADWLLPGPLSRTEFSEKMSIVVNVPVFIDRNNDLPTYDH